MLHTEEYKKVVLKWKLECWFPAPFLSLDFVRTHFTRQPVLLWLSWPLYLFLSIWSLAWRNTAWNCHCSLPLSHVVRSNIISYNLTQLLLPINHSWRFGEYWIYLWTFIWNEPPLICLIDLGDNILSTVWKEQLSSYSGCVLWLSLSFLVCYLSTWSCILLWTSFQAPLR